MRGRHFRGFLVVLGLTALVWLAMAMSEADDYPLMLNVRFSGFDAKRFAVASADSVVTVQVHATRFNMLRNSLKNESATVNIDVRNDAVRRHVRQRGDAKDLHLTMAAGDLSPMLANLFSGQGMKVSGISRDTLQLVLNERSHKVFRPSLGQLRINFSEGYGLYGEPMVTPKEVTLYGPEEVLAKIETVEVKPTELDNVQETGSYRISLDERWKGEGDVYASTSELMVNIPVKRFVERELTVPITIDDGNKRDGLRLYPEHVVLKVWVPEDDLWAVTPDLFVVTAKNSDILNGTQRLKLSLSRFPRSVRIRSMQPAEIEYVIIK